jgi:spermidine synthase
MTNNHRIETRTSTDGLCFYIDGSLQFDTRDEFIYHESLVIPAASILSARKPNKFIALILGGGDGLALRELLKYDQLQQVDLVDYDAGVIESAKTQFAPWNKSSLSDSRVCVFTEEAGEYLKNSNKRYDLIIVDFTFPDRLETCRVFTGGFYSLLKDRLVAHGMIALNSISPDLSAPAYWSIFKTLKHLNLNPKPFKSMIPSFVSHGYGSWGFFFCSPQPIVAHELKTITIDVPVKHLNKDIFLGGMKFNRRHVSLGLSLSKVLQEPSDLLCLLNTRLNLSGANDLVLDFSDSNTEKELALLDISQNMLASLISPEWQGKITAILKSLNWEALLEEIKKHLGSLSDSLKKEFASLRKEIHEILREKVFQWYRVAKVLSTFLLLVVFINLLYPDNVFAKGYYGNGSSNNGEQVLLFSPNARAAFYTLPLGLLALEKLSNTQITNPTVSYVNADGSIKSENFFFALTDDLYISEAGRVYLIIAKLPQYEFQVTPSQLILFEKGGASPIFEFAQDPMVKKSLSQNIAMQKTALERTLKDYQAWLTWAGPAEVVFQEVRTEKKDLAKLLNLQMIFDHLQTIYPDVSPFTQDLDIQDSVKLAPGVYLSNQHAILLKQPEGTWRTYAFKGFLPDTAFTSIQTTPAMDSFLEALIRMHLSSQEMPQAIKGVLYDGFSVKPRVN